MTYSFLLKTLNLQILQMTTQYMWVVKIWQNFLEILRKKCETPINWFKINNMIVNPDKFQSTIISSKKDLRKSLLNINGVELTME